MLRLLGVFGLIVSCYFARSMPPKASIRHLPSHEKHSIMSNRIKEHDYFTKAEKRQLQHHLDHHYKIESSNNKDSSHTK